MNTLLENEEERREQHSIPGGIISSYSTNNRLLESFYDVPCEQLAKNLLGHVLVRKLNNGKLLKGKIVETECYPGGNDKASHSYQGKFTDKNAPMYMKPGTSYVYFTYGMYHCFNISSKGAGAAVLLRAIDPIEGIDFMLEERTKRRKKPSIFKQHQLANGPSKLCISMNIEKGSCNAQDMCCWSGMWVEETIRDVAIPSDPDWLAAVQPSEIVSTSRIGIDSAGAESASKPFRFYILGNPSVSKRDKIKEKEMNAPCDVPSRKKQRLSAECIT